MDEPYYAADKFTPMDYSITRLALSVVLLGLVRPLAVGAVLQPPAIEWQASIGSGGIEEVANIQPTEDGGVIVAGSSLVLSADVPGNKTSTNSGDYDFWVVRLDANGNKLWDRSYGGSGFDDCWTIQPASGGGFVLGGLSQSPASGNKGSTNFGGSDYWVVRIDSEGNTIWDKTYGGTGGDGLRAIVPTSDGGFLLGGDSDSIVSGNKTNTQQGLWWLVRIDDAGNKLWERSIGGTNTIRFYTMGGTADGGFVLGGETFSPIGGTNYGRWDYLCIRIDGDGNTIWEKSFGGSESDWLVSVEQTMDGGFILAGESISGASGNKTVPGPPGLFVHHAWIIRLDPAGSILWQRAFNVPSTPSKITQLSDGGFVILTESASPPQGDKTSPAYGSTDLWAVRMDPNGNILWDQSFGGGGSDDVHAAYNVAREGWGRIIADSAGGYLLAGSSSSPASGNKTTPLFGDTGVSDYWVLKLGPERYRLTLTTNFPERGVIVVSPGAGSDGLYPAFAQVTLEAVPSPGYAFAFWSGSISTVTNPIQFVAVSNAAVTANFVGLTEPEIGHIPASFAWVLPPNQSQATATFSVWNAGGGILRYSNSVDVPWISVQPASAVSLGETNAHTISINAGSLAFWSNHVASITIHPEGGAPLPETISVTVLRESVPARLTVPRQFYWQMLQNGFRAELTGQSNATYRIDYSPDLTNWYPLQTNQLINTSTAPFFDRDVTNTSQRFFRSVLVN